MARSDTETNKHQHFCIWRLRVNDDDDERLTLRVDTRNDNKQQVEWKQEEKKKRTGGVKTGWIAHILMSLFLISAKGNNACH